MARVIDGDSLEINGERIRLAGIDACELDQYGFRNGEVWHCGWLAAGWMVAKVSRKTVSCTGDARDRYGRLLAVCTASGEDLGGALVAQGLAVAYRRNGKATAPGYDDFEIFAKNREWGLWGTENFVTPRSWRKGVR